MIKDYPRDVFLHLLAIVSIYTVAGSFIALLFQYINVFFPDPLNPYYDAGSSIRWSLALLIIIFPVFVWVSRFLRKETAANPEKAEYRIRKWLVYFTLFAAALLIIGDLVALIFNFLEGELSTRFILKIFAVLLVAGAVFGYYLYDLRRSPSEFSNRAKIFVYAAMAVVALAVIGGFFVAGSPFKQRLVRFDRQKVNDLQVIQAQIINYWIQKSRLPGSLGDLEDSISGFKAPNDAQSGRPYEYKLTGQLNFELCAEFNLPSVADTDKIFAPMAAEPYFAGRVGENWSHAAGPVCFQRQIDPELYKPQPKM